MVFKKLNDDDDVDDEIASHFVLHEWENQSNTAYTFRMIRLGLLLCIFAKLATSLDDRVVSTNQGLVRGYRPVDEDYFVFYGIPYATAPTGRNKFGPPLPPPTWNDTYEAVQNYVICPQGLRVKNGTVVKRDPKLKVQENCLITNIYVPDTNNTKLPVVVYVHGGAYQFSYGNVRTAINLLKSKKVVIVNFNYRVGPHGFLCLGTKDVPGNAGMKDQVALLRWVQKNIANFGGNPNDVTINGWSAGAAAADLLAISKITKGLFHKVIIESGTNAASFSIQIDPLANAKMIASQLGLVEVDNLEKLEAFYTNATYDLLTSIDVSNRPDSSTVFAPCMERNVGQELFLDDYPINILSSGNFSKLPMLYGIANMEGLYRLEHFDSWKDLMNQNFTEVLPEDLIFKNEDEQKKAENKIKKLYFDNKPVCDQNILSFIQYYTDVMFALGAAKSVELQVAAGNQQIYLYEYAFADQSEPLIKYTNTRGATHCAQTSAVMDLENESNLSEDYKHMKKVMRDLWLNFMTTGKPVSDCSPYPKWPAVKAESFQYMLLNSTLALKSNFLNDRKQLWDKIYKKGYKHPIPPNN